MRAQRAIGKSLPGIIFVGLSVVGCTTAPQSTPTASQSSATVRPSTTRSAKVTYNYTAKDRDCLKRAMYFESEHSDRNGYMAVGTVVMNRMTSPAYPDTICGVVSQERQFAPGLMTRVVSPQADSDLDSAADSILRGERNPAVKNAMFFHTEGLTFPYHNMHYVTVAGGNAFYEKRGLDGALETPAPLPAYEVAMNYVSGQQTAGATQFDLILPTVGPVPTLLPASAETVIPESMAPVAVPLPRPATLDNASLRGGRFVGG